MPIIGIITRESISPDGHKINVIYDDIKKAIIKNGGLPVGIILNENYKVLISLCNGIIFQGGDDFEKYDFEVLKYIYDINKPVLGICLGMQLMGMLFEGSMVDIKNHKSKLNYVHEIKIRQNSKLNTIFKYNILKVNSRHKSIIKSTNLNIVGLSQDGVIEAIEDPNKKFFIGVQWHPENMVDYDEKQNNLFKYFIECCR